MMCLLANERALFRGENCNCMNVLYSDCYHLNMLPYGFGTCTGYFIVVSIVPISVPYKLFVYLLLELFNAQELSLRRQTSGYGSTSHSGLFLRFTPVSAS